MLTITETGQASAGGGPTRRDVLQIGASSLGGLTLAGLLAARSHAAWVVR